MGNKVKKCFLISAKNRKPYHLQNLKARYKENFVEVENLGEAELVLCIDQDNLNQLERENILKAKELGIKISYFTDELLPDNILKMEIEELTKAYSVTIKDEIQFSQEEL